MVSPLALWLSAHRRHRWCGDPSKIPTHLDDVLAALPPLRAAFDAPPPHIREGRWEDGSSWRIRSPRPYVRVFVFLSPAEWCAAEVWSRMPLPCPVAIPVPPGRSRSYPDTDLPPALAEPPDGLSRFEGVYDWSSQPIQRVHEWLDAAAAYLTRQRAILADLADWAAEAALLDPRKAGHAGRIARAVPEQRRAMERLAEASAAYRPVLDDVRIKVPKSDPDPVVKPEVVLGNWARRQTWLVVKDPDRDRMIVCRDTEFPQHELSKNYWAPMEATIGGVTHRLARLTELPAAHLAERTDDAPAHEALEVVWDERSIALCDREIAGLWSRMDAEHDLPGDFASVWQAYSGYDYRSVVARSREGTRQVPRAVESTVPRRRNRYGTSGGGGDGGFAGAVGACSGGGGCGGGGGGGGCGGGC
jgi:hypothetical protein